MLLVKYAKLDACKNSVLQYLNFFRMLVTNCFVVFHTMPHMFFLKMIGKGFYRK